MAEILPFRRTHSRRVRPQRDSWVQAAGDTGPILWSVSLALFVAVFFATAPELGSATVASTLSAGSDREVAQFGRCGGWGGSQNCVIDGDTFRYRGQKIRIADINTPETSNSKCAAEAELGAKATARLTQLLNAGAFSLEPADRTHDSYGRALFTVTRGGASVGSALVREGLAERWRGYRREWC